MPPPTHIVTTTYLHAAPLALDERVTGHARARHAVGMADRDRAAVDVHLVGVDAEPVAAVQHLGGERLVQFPQIDFVDGQAVLRQQVGHGEDRADAHLVRRAAGDRHAAIDTERLKAASRGFGFLHQDHGGGAIGKLRGVAGGDELPLLHHLAVGEDRLQAGQTLQRGLWPVALVLGYRDLLPAGFPGGLVGDQHLGGQRHDFIVEPASLLRRRGALLGAQRVFVLRLARDVVAVGDEFGGLDHRHVEAGDARPPGPDPARAERLMASVCTRRDDLQAAADSDLHVVVDDLFGRGGDRHQAGGALPVHGHAGDAVRQTGAQSSLAGDVEAL